MIYRAKPKAITMSDSLSLWQIARSDKTTARSQRKWLTGFWIVSVVIGTTGWWAGLALAAAWLAQHAIS